jgi:hypothetical protein
VKGGGWSEPLNPVSDTQVRALQTAQCGRAAYDAECRRRIDHAHQQLCRHAAQLRGTPLWSLVNPTMAYVLNNVLNSKPESV